MLWREGDGVCCCEGQEGEDRELHFELTLARRFDEEQWKKMKRGREEGDEGYKEEDIRM